jgi:hypothetical protein
VPDVCRRASCTRGCGRRSLAQWNPAPAPSYQQCEATRSLA